MRCISFCPQADNTLFPGLHCCFLAIAAQSPLGFVTSVFIICLSSSMEVQGLPLTLVSPTGKQATPHLPAKTFANQQGPRDASRQLTTEETELEKHLRCIFGDSTFTSQLTCETRDYKSIE